MIAALALILGFGVGASTIPAAAATASNTGVAQVSDGGTVSQTSSFSDFWW